MWGNVDKLDMSNRAIECTRQARERERMKNHITTHLAGLYTQHTTHSIYIQLCMYTLTHIPPDHKLQMVSVPLQVSTYSMTWTITAIATGRDLVLHTL